MKQPKPAPLLADTSVPAAFHGARFAWENAPRLCANSGFDCLNYHRIRPSLRQLGLSAEPEDQRSFLFPALVDALSAGGTRLLISGSADEAMAAMVFEAAEEAKKIAEISVIDRCATPLALTEAFAQALGTAILTAQSDILEYETDHPFDLIVTHSFLGQFAPDARKQLMEKWFELLRPGGRVVTVARLRPSSEVRSFLGDAPIRLADEVRRRAFAHTDELGSGPEELAQAALQYAQQRSRSFPIHSLEEAEQLFKTAGFQLLHAAAIEATGRVTGIEGPGLPRSGFYAELVALRP
jgi:SAM-dependent methyltransferase